MDLRVWQEQLLRGVLLAAAIVGLLVAVAGTYDAYVYRAALDHTTVLGGV